MTEVEKRVKILKALWHSQCECEIHLVAQGCHHKRTASDEQRTKPSETNEINGCVYS